MYIISFKNMTDVVRDIAQYVRVIAHMKFAWKIRNHVWESRI